MQPNPELHRPPPDLPVHRPYPELAKAIRSQTENILAEWRGRTLFVLPKLSGLTTSEFIDDVQTILTIMADALETSSAADLLRLVQTAPAHGFQRFLQQCDLAEVFTEERILRRVLVARLEESMGRCCTADEAAALHALIDLTLQQGVLGLVAQQKQELRRSAEAELKYLAFLSHDLGNNLFIITSQLEAIQRELALRPDMAATAEQLDATLKVITRTTRGMQTLLQYERLRPGHEPLIAPVRLRETVEAITKVIEGDVRETGCALEVTVDPDATVNTDASLLTIVLQNLVSNAVKHACNDGGTMVSVSSVRRPPALGAIRDNNAGYWEVAVHDDGEGITQDKLAHLFEPFEPPAVSSCPAPPAEPGEKFGGWGLGLAIAGQAATLLGTRIEVQSEPGKGSTFWCLLPAA